MLYYVIVFCARNRNICPVVWSAWSERIRKPTDPFRRGPGAHPSKPAQRRPPSGARRPLFSDSPST